MTITTEEILQTKLLAKAVIEKNGKIEIVAVFAGSEFYKFFFVFTARSKRSPFRAWKWTGRWQIIDAGLNQTYTLKTYLERWYAGREVVLRYYIPKKYLATFTDRVARVYSTTQPVMPAGASFEYANWITSGKHGNKPRAFRGATKTGTS